MNYVAVGLVGLCAGMIGGLFGVGGGIVMVPALILLLNLEPKLAIGTSLMVIIPTALAGSLTHHTMGHVQWKAVLLLTPLAVLGSVVGAKLTGPLHAESLKRAFGVFMICVGVYMTFFHTKKSDASSPPPTEAQAP